MTSEFVLGISNATNLLDEKIGGRALLCSDDYFASMHNLVKPGRGVFLPDEYTPRGKWMDGWESRRKRDPGHDWCILKLGVPGVLFTLDIDTNHFLGNHPSFASVEACFAPNADDEPETLHALEWKPLLHQVPLLRGSQNLFLTHNFAPVTHLKLHIYPDGGVARFRAYGQPIPSSGAHPDDERYPIRKGEVDLAALRNGGQGLLCSDMFFSPMSNLIAPGRSHNMGGGWETRRSRRVGYDWVVVRLGAIGTTDFVVVDTNHFKGNFPHSFSLHGLHAPTLPLIDFHKPDLPWQQILPQTKLQAHHEHLFREEVQNHGPFSHIKLQIYPDGGVSRLRVYGRKLPNLATVLNGMAEDACRDALTRCCGAKRWVEAMLQARPFPHTQAVFQKADLFWKTMLREDILEAFSHHPKIGSNIEELRKKFSSTQQWSSQEQAAVQQADEATLEALAKGNKDYEETFGYIFIVCATGKSAQEMLSLLEARLHNDPDEELRIAAAEQAKITTIRLRKLVESAVNQANPKN